MAMKRAAPLSISQWHRSPGSLAFDPRHPRGLPPGQQHRGWPDPGTADHSPLAADQPGPVDPHSGSGARPSPAGGSALLAVCGPVGPGSRLGPVARAVAAAPARRPVDPARRGEVEGIPMPLAVGATRSVVARPIRIRMPVDALRAPCAAGPAGRSSPGGSCCGDPDP
jgi:hypothetical protein